MCFYLKGGKKHFLLSHITSTENTVHLILSLMCYIENPVLLHTRTVYTLTTKIKHRVQFRARLSKVAQKTMLSKTILLEHMKLVKIRYNLNWVYSWLCSLQHSCLPEQYIFSAWVKNTFSKCWHPYCGGRLTVCQQKKKNHTFWA